MPDTLEQTITSALAGDRGALARLLSVVERGGEPLAAVEQAVQPRLGEGYCVGITGAPGAGKSTLASALTATICGDHAQRVALLAVDPSSPLSRGALLGDRVRMQAHLASAHVFIRSMASRGHMGGLALATRGARRVLEACGWPLILIETVGVGQVELDVAGATDTVVVVLNPGWGDEVQANKAGLMEIADIFVINKADRPGTDSTRRDLEGALASFAPERRPAIVETVATEQQGLTELWQAITAHRAAITTSGELAERRRAQVQSELLGGAAAQVQRRLATLFAHDGAADLVRDVASGAIDIYSAGALVLQRLGLVAEDS